MIRKMQLKTRSIWQKFSPAGSHSMKLGARLFASLLVFVFIFGAAARPASGAVQSEGQSPDLAGLIFSRQVVDSQKFFSLMSPNSMKLDSNKVPHIAYGGDHLYYASQTGSTWHVETVDNADGVGLYASLVLASNNVPHISYYDAFSGALKYAYFNGTSWVIQVVDSRLGKQSEPAPSLNLDIPYNSYLERNWRDGFTDPTSADSATGKGVGQFSSIALDAFGYPWIAYYDSDNADLKLAHFSGSSWVIEVVDSDYNVGKFASLTLDSHGYPAISYFDETNGDLRYAHFNGNKWEYKLVDSGSKGVVGQFTSITLDSKDKPYISYYDSTNGNLKYAHIGSSGWYSQTLDSGGDVGLYTSISLNLKSATTPKPNIAYFDETNNRLKLASYSGTAWTITIIPVTGDLGRYVSLVMDGNGVRLSYYNTGKGELHYTFGSGSTWTTQTVDSAADVGLYNSMVLDANRNPLISYFDDVHDDLKYAVWDGSSWKSYTLDFSGSVGLFTSIALDGSGKPHISYYDSGNDSIKHTYWNGANWIIQTAVSGVKGNSYVSTGMGTSLGIDSHGNPRIAYFDGNAKNLKVALWTGSQWVTRVADDSDADTGRYPSLKIDKSDNILVSYYSATTKHLRFAVGTPDGSSWEKSHPDNSNEVGMYSSLALNSNGLPSIAYYEDDGDHLKYAYFDGSIWHDERVDDSSNVTGLHPSLVMDANNNPNISYYDLTMHALMFARWNGSNWDKLVVDNHGDVGEFSSIGLDAAGYPVISYYNGTTGDLFYTKAASARLIYLPMIVK